MCIKCLLGITLEQEAVSRLVPENSSVLSFIYELCVIYELTEKKKRNMLNTEDIVIHNENPKNASQSSASKNVMFVTLKIYDFNKC